MSYFPVLYNMFLLIIYFMCCGLYLLILYPYLPLLLSLCPLVLTNALSFLLGK